MAMTESSSSAKERMKEVIFARDREKKTTCSMYNFSADTVSNKKYRKKLFILG